MKGCGKMKNIRIILFSILSMIFTSNSEVITLKDWAFNVNGTCYESVNEILPVNMNDDLFDWEIGFGQLSIDFASGAAGDYIFLSFFDYEIDEKINTYFNESGEAIGTTDENLVWEIDEPGYSFGDIYDHVLYGELFDNTNNIPVNFEDDVSMGLGYLFHLESYQSAVIDITLTTSAPGGGFYLMHSDSESGTPNNIYFSMALNISGKPPVDPPTGVPEPGILFFLMSSAILFTFFKKLPENKN